MRPGRSIPLLVALAVCGAQASAQTAGRAEVAIQGYYLRIADQPLNRTTGAVINFDEFVPKVGLFRGNLSGYRTNSGLRPADNYLQLRGLVFQGLRWNFSGGDFQSTGTLVRNPFTNLFFPQIQARGIQVEAGDEHQSYYFFKGRETLLAGPRIPFRLTIPQNVTGGGFRRAFGGFETGLRYTRFDNLPRTDQQSSLFPLGRDFRNADNLTFFTALKSGEHFRWYGEATAARTEGLDGTHSTPPLSYVFGPSWESPRFTAKANYTSLSAAYLPIPGYFVGNRRGPFGEVRFKLTKRIELSSSASKYETIDRGPSLPTYNSTNMTQGVSVELPAQVYTSVQYSSMRFSAFDASGASVPSTNKFLTATVSRRFGQHSLRVTGRDMRLVSNRTPSRQRAVEVEDSFRLGPFILGAAVRHQQDNQGENRSSLYVRGSAQLNVKRLTLFGYYEDGKDLANQTVFATNNTNSAIINASFQLPGQWSIQGEAFRTRLISQINDQNLFVQGNQNLLLNPILSQFNQWSVLLRVARTFTWGNGIPGGIGNFDVFTSQRIPITGPVEGMVLLLADGDKRPAQGVAVTLENGASTLTGADGIYRFANVPEGPHIVRIDMELLPADYNPGPVQTAQVSIGPRKMTRVDFEVYSLSGFSGRVQAAPDAKFETLEGIVIRLEPNGQFTTTDRDGRFAFYNLPDGNYVASVDMDSLPAGAELQSSQTVQVGQRTGTPVAPIEFQLKRREEPAKPVRQVFENVVGLGQ